MKLPVFDCLINESLNDESGIYAISFVDTPANEVDFIALSAQKVIGQQLRCNTQKQVLTGVVLRPNQLIYRNDRNLGEHYIRFGVEEIEKIARKMMKSGIALHNTTHQHQQNLTNNYLTELWIVEDPQKDKSTALGFAPQEKGTLMCSYKIENTNYWQTHIMTGNVKGFSLEGLFFQQTSDNSNNQPNKNKMNKTKSKQHSLLSKLARFFLNISDIEKNDTTTSGTPYLIFTLADGKEVYIDSDGFATLDGEQFPAGEHPLSDGNTLAIDEQGQFIETKENSYEAKDPEQAAAPQTLSIDSTDALKSKIAELEEKLSQLAVLAQDANAEVQKLRKVTPSTLPATTTTSKIAESKRHEQMAHALSQSLKQNKRK